MTGTVAAEKRKEQKQKQQYDTQFPDPVHYTRPMIWSYSLNQKSRCTVRKHMFFEVVFVHGNKLYTYGNIPKIELDRTGILTPVTCCKKSKSL